MRRTSALPGTTRRCLGTLLFAALALSASATLSAEVEMLLAPPPSPARGGEEILVRLYVHNYAAEAVRVELPSALRCVLVQGALRLEREMTRREPSADSVVLPPHGFLRAAYALTLPAESEGPVILEVAELPVPPAMLAVDRWPGQARAAQGGSPGSGPPAAEELPLREKVLRRFSGHEPIYFLMGVNPEDSKFQVSFKFQLFEFDKREGSRLELLNGIHLAYTQSSYWDLKSESRPFLDNGYKPEILYALEDITAVALPGVARWDLRAGVQHESNGRSGADSRSINIAYLRPRLLFGDLRGYYLELAPKAWGYLGSLDENPGIHKYRGYGELLAALGKADGIRLATSYRQGTAKASVQVDATYPLFDILPGRVALYLHAQYFSGYAENLLNFNRRNEAFRLGFSVYR
jgi:outer membrane phospholipase A